MQVVDANVILRYLLNDDPGQSSIAKKAIDAGARADIEVFAEVVYVLKGVYGVPRDVIAQALTGLLNDVECPRNQVLLMALDRFGKTGFDFVDCVLIATATVDHVKVLTFDKRLAKALDEVNA